jgi:ketosteroid isomerase-like protein
VRTSIDAGVAAGVHAAVAGYAHALDAGRPGDVADLFCPDGVAEIAGSGTFAGRDAIRAGYAMWAPGTPQLHLVANTVVTGSTGDRATATSDLAFFRRGAAGWALHLVGRYEDTLHLTGGRWLFHHRRTTFRR